ncbi:hypothetical protein [Georgenia wangjunii]|uniref:hypothetical protein n=1 Tax=Georgenia wangjunii TaxID=3117730 RepID=UPI002F25F7A8
MGAVERDGGRLLGEDGHRERVRDRRAAPDGLRGAHADVGERGVPRVDPEPLRGGRDGEEVVGVDTLEVDRDRYVSAVVDRDAVHGTAPAARGPRDELGRGLEEGQDLDDALGDDGLVRVLRRDDAHAVGELSGRDGGRTGRVEGDRRGRLRPREEARDLRGLDRRPAARDAEDLEPVPLDDLAVVADLQGDRLDRPCRQLDARCL